jgi:hypothetical protein
MTLTSLGCASYSSYAYRRCGKCGMPETLKRNELGWFIAPSCNCDKPVIVNTVVLTNTAPLKEQTWLSPLPNQSPDWCI